MYVCNITGQKFDVDETEKDRELASRFGFNSRDRAMCFVFTKLFYGKCRVLSDLKENKKLKGIGMTDNEYAPIFEKKFDYTNTFYHTSPYLDIYNNDHVKNYNDLDFIISSDVFQNIDPYPSVQIAFDNLYKMLKQGGSIIFTVPFTHNEHIENFPNLYKYEIKQENDAFILYNTTIDNKSEIINNLNFHGGPGNVLEMRIFSKKSINSFLEKSGFVDIVFYEINKNMKKCGIFWSNTDSLIISAKKP
jgi:hypothetical protein